MRNKEEILAWCARIEKEYPPQMWPHLAKLHRVESDYDLELGDFPVWYTCVHGVRPKENQKQEWDSWLFMSAMKRIVEQNMSASIVLNTMTCAFCGYYEKYQTLPEVVTEWEEWPTLVIGMELFDREHGSNTSTWGSEHNLYRQEIKDEKNKCEILKLLYTDLREIPWYTLRDAIKNEDEKLENVNEESLIIH